LQGSGIAHKFESGLASSLGSGEWQYSAFPSFIGRSTHPPGAAKAHARYITRPDAFTLILGERMPTDCKLNASGV
jgi:hypothetical protein